MSVMNSNGELKSSGASVVKAGSWDIRQRCIGGHQAKGTGITRPVLVDQVFW